MIAERRELFFSFLSALGKPQKLLLQSHKMSSQLATGQKLQGRCVGLSKRVWGKQKGVYKQMHLKSVIQLSA